VTARPPSLAGYLANGGTLDGFPRLGLLVEQVACDRGRLPAWRVFEEIAFDADDVEHLLGADDVVPSGRQQTLTDRRTLATFYLWSTELLTCGDDLVAAFFDALPADQRTRWLDLRAEYPLAPMRAATLGRCNESRFDNCANCDRVLDEGDPAVAITPGAAAGGDGGSLYYCRPCIQRALAAAT
jgi:hypothetical protein